MKKTLSTRAAEGMASGPSQHYFEDLKDAMKPFRPQFFGQYLHVLVSRLSTLISTCLLSTKTNKEPVYFQTPNGGLAWEAYLLWFVSLFMCFGFLFGEVKFAKIGIPLPMLDYLGEIPNLSLKLFMSELFLIFSVGLMLAYILRTRDIATKVTSLEQLCLAILVWAGCVWLLTKPNNLLLAYRNSVFCWYLIVPLALSKIPVTSKAWDKLFGFLGILAGIWVCSTYFFRLFFGGTGGFLFVQIGLAPIIGFILMTKKRSAAYVCMTLVACTFGQLIVTKMQRTTMVSAIAVVIILLLFKRELWKQYIARLSLFFLVGTIVALTEPLWNREIRNFVPNELEMIELAEKYGPPPPPFDADMPIGSISGSFMGNRPRHLPPKLNKETPGSRYASGSHTESQQIAPPNVYQTPQRRSRPPQLRNNLRSKIFGSMEKAELTQQGLEKFRLSMWKDALGLFQAHPWWGIGFEQQVVYRIRIGSDAKGADNYYPNDGTWSPHSDLENRPPPPPMSGPHNSYINAMARMGIPAVLLLVLHGLSGVVLWRQKLFFCFFVLLGQAVYAMFNVGLEGPARGYVILFAIAAAIKAQREQLSKQGL